MKEKLQEYALIAEIVSALVIVFSLFFVGVQIEQANSIAKADSYHDLMVGINQSTGFLLQDKELAELVISANSGGLENIDAADQLRVNLSSQNLFRIYDSAYYYFQYKVLGETEWERISDIACGLWTILNEQSKETVQNTISQKFRLYIESEC